jgi:hypothetical protein
MRIDQAMGGTPRPGERRHGHPLGLVPACLLALLLLAGCDWLAQPGVDARREGNYQDGLRWKEQGRPTQARDSFYRALDVNPQNYHAHLQLGDLYRSDGSNQVRSIYHYERYKELAAQQSDGGKFKDQSAEDGIRNARIELARTYANTLLNDQRGAESEAMRRTNAFLLQQVQFLQQQNLQLATKVASLTNPIYVPPATSPPAPTTLTQVPPALVVQPPGRPVAIQPTPPRGPTSPTNPTNPARPPETPRPQPAQRTHRVASGENFNRIAQRYGIKPASLQAANPRVDPKRMKPGLVLIVPPK